MSEPSAARKSRKRSVGLFGFFALGFGCIVGSGWVVLLGDWLERAGPLGAGLGLLAGGAVMILVGLCYGELSSRVPMAGADYIYTRVAFGRATGFAVGWFLLLYLLLIISFEGIALAWMLETIVPHLKGATAYVSVGMPVTFEAIAVGLLGVGLIAGLNLVGTPSAVRFQSLITVIFLITAVSVLSAAATLGEQRGVPEFVGPDIAIWSGALWVFSTAAIFYNGFQAIPQVVEERADRVSFRALSSTIAVSIGAAAAFYSLVVVSTSVAAPWRWTVQQELPAAAAVQAAIPGLGLVLLSAAAISVIKTWNALFITAVQTVVALSRDGILPHGIARVNGRRAYVPATCLVATINIIGILIGRGGVTPLIDMASISIGLVMVACCIAVYRLRKRSGPAPFTVPGGNVTVAIATLGTLLMAVAGITVILLRSGPPVELMLMVLWALIGAGCWYAAVRKSAAPVLSSEPSL